MYSTRPDLNPFWRNTKTEKHRGETEKAWNKAQIAKSNAGLQAAGGYGSAAGSELASIAPQFQAIAANPMSAEEKAGTLSAAGGAYDAASQAAGQRMAKTRNAAGYGELLDELARGKSRDMAKTASDLGNTEFQRRMAALGGLGNLYSTNVGAQTNLLRPGDPMKVPGFWDNFLGQLVGAGGQVGAAALKG